MHYVFGDYSLDTQRYELRHTGELIPLGPQVFNVLAYLVAHCDRVVSHNELFARLWPDQFVTDDALGRCIRAARRALQDRPEAPRYITTTRKRGYRFIAPVQEQPHGPPEDGMLTTVPCQSIPPPPSAAGTEGPPLQVSVPMVSGELQRLSEGFRPPVLAGEYKQVTVLCGGLADALALAVRLGPEAMHQRMQTVFALVHQVLHRYGGSLIEFGGEGFVALFGAPEAQEDHAQRAVLAALALHVDVAASAPDLGQAPTEPLALCLGLHTGRVVVDRLGGDIQRLYTAAGETMQVALRLRQLAAPGTTLLSAATQQLVHEHVRAEPRGEVMVSEAQAPMLVYGVRGIAPQRSGVVGYGARARSPFVGRARELALLQERLDAVVAGQGQVVAVVGEPGMGKSRLLAEFCRGLVGREVRYVEGHCLSYGNATPYLPVVDLVRQLCGMTPGEPHAAITAAVHRRLQQADLDPDEGVPLVLSLLDIPLETERLAQLSPPERKARTFALLRHLVLHEAQRHPCILTVENLHWSDVTSEEWLTSLVERLAGAALLVLVTYRPGYQPTWLAQSYATQIALSPLRAGHSRTVVQAVLQTASVPETVVQEIVTHAAGNPFFLEELAWHVIEHRGGPPAPLAVPETIEAVLAARIDRLPPAEKRLLQTAAVIGMAVPVPLLQAVTDLATAELHTHLNHLQTAEFLYETGRLPAAAYTFKHALTYEVAYGSLLQERRRALHARIVEALETLGGERMAEQVERLAHHALRGEVWHKALAYCRQAGEKALARSAHREAVGYFEQALSALSQLPETHDAREQAIDLRLALRSALRPLSNLERILALLREAETLAEALDDPRRLAQVTRFLSLHYYLMGTHDQAIAAAQRALAFASASGEGVLQALANLYLGLAYQAQGNYHRAIDCFGQTVASFEGARRRERFGQVNLPAVMSRAHLAWCHAELGTFAEGRVLGEEGLRIAEAVDHPSSLMRAYWGIGLLSIRQGDLHRGLPLLERAVGLCQDADLPVYFPLMAAALGAAYTLSGRVADAVPLLTQAMEHTAAAETANDWTLCRLSLGEAQMLAGRLEEAHALAQGALAHARAHQERGLEAYALHLLGEIAAHRYLPESMLAEAYYRQALALAEELGMRPLQAHCHFGLGTLYSQIGRLEQAGAELIAAIYLYRAMDMTFWLPQAETALAQVV